MCHTDTTLGTLTLAVEEVAEERSDYGCSNREPTEDVGSCFGRDAVEVALQHVGTVALEREDGTMEHADRLYGVTMQEEGVSKLLELSLSDVDKIEK